MNEQITFEIGPDGEILNPREPLPAFDLELCGRNGWMLISSDDYYHYFASGTKALCGSTKHGIVGSGNWRVVDCPDCRRIGQARQPLLNMTVPDIGAVAGELADATVEAQDAQCFREITPES